MISLDETATLLRVQGKILSAVEGEALGDVRDAMFHLLIQAFELAIDQAEPAQQEHVRQGAVALLYHLILRISFPTSISH
jgi:hypothetical protein